jgi:hypothetical protein
MLRGPYRVGDFGENQLKGINLSMKALRKRYKFITGWQLNEEWDKSPVSVRIDIIVDFKKVGEYYNVEMDEWWIEHSKIKPIDTAYILSFAEVRENNRDYEETKAIRNYLNEIYEIIPDEFSTFWGHEGEIYGESVVKCDLTIWTFTSSATQDIYYSV